MRIRSYLSLVLGLGMNLILMFMVVSVAAPLVNVDGSSAGPPSSIRSTPGALIKPAGTAKPKVSGAYTNHPLRFEANQGQTDGQVKFVARAPGYTLFLTSTEAVLATIKPGTDVQKILPPPSRRKRSREQTAGQERASPTVLRMKLVGANATPKVAGLEELSGKVNYFRGNDPTKWRKNIPTYAKVQYEAVYPGVHLVYYGNQRRLEYDFVVAPGADPKAITLAFSGAERLRIDPQGDLILLTSSGEVRMHHPLVYQEVGGARRSISSHFVLKDKHQVSFQVAAYDTGKPLIIDPVLAYSTYLGGSDGGDMEWGLGIATDGAGNAYVTGRTPSTDFPTVNPYQQDPGGGYYDAFVTKFNPAGALVYSTYLGGGSADLAWSIAVDAAGNAYVTGETDSADFPAVNSLQLALPEGGHGFVTKLNPAGSELVYSAYLRVGPYGIAVDAGGHAYVAVGDFVAKLNPAGSELVYSTSVGSISDIAVDANGHAYVGGAGGFVAKLNPAGSELVYSTFVRGTDCSDCWIGGIAVDAGGHAYVIREEGFVAKLNPAGSELVYFTQLGGYVDGIGVDAAGNAYVVGTAYLEPDPYNGHAFVRMINPTGSAVYTEYLNGSSQDEGLAIAVDASGNVYVTGYTSSPDFPLLNASQQLYKGHPSDAFVAKLSLNTPSSEVPVTVSPTAGTSMTFPSVSSPGETTVTARSSGPTPPAGFSLGDPPSYYDITTTATFTSPVTVCITYDPMQFSDQNNLHLLHFENNDWVDVTTTNDTVNHIICGRVSSLSPFIIAQQSNVPPGVGTLSSVPAAVGDSVVIAIGSSISFSAPWTDPNVSDTHTALCNIVDVSGGTPVTSVAGTAPGSGSGTTTCNFTLGNAGIFSVTMTVTDQDGASGTSTAIQVVVYDPSAGFVTGGGWFTPDPQTCVCTPGGKATFGFVSKYKKGTSIPTGNQEFQYRVDNINLHSTSFDWLVVGGPQAQFQGTGTINGVGAYKFRATVRDGDLIGQADRFEIRILPAGSTDFGGTHLWKGGNDLTGSNGAGSIVIHH